MALAPGTRLGPYEIVAAVGAGGMGEVYRGRDTRLDRTVAIKVLPDSVAGSPDRLARFEREAKTLAAFNHTNIAQIYGLEQGALAMEFVEGEDLSQLISRGPVPVDEALAIAAQIADALEAAHEAGIIHRDLKPSNVRVREDGTIKVLDFGLAKALEPSTAVSAISAPTSTSPAITELGVILGTAGYMSPEQARGKAVDKRVDIWAFGVVLYEITTGRRPFDGDTVTEAIAALLKSEPDWTAVPPRLHRLLKSCLEKDPKRRLRDIGDWRRLLDDATPPSHRTFGRWAWLTWGAGVVGLAAAGVLAAVHFNERPVVARPVRFSVPAPVQMTFELGFAVAPDGRRVAFIARDVAGVSRLWIRDFDSLDARVLAGTDGARSPAWKPDGQFIAFVVDRWLRKVPVAGGPVVTLHEAASDNAIGSATWSQHGDILFGGIRTGALRRVPESGGAVSTVSVVDTSRQEIAHGLPMFLPDGRHFVYVRVSRTGEHNGLFVGSLDRKPEEQETNRLLEADSQAAYVQTGEGTGRLLFLRRGTLLSQGFDLDRRSLSGEARPVADGIGNSGAFGFFSASPAALVYRTGPVTGAGRPMQLTLIDRQGQRLSEIGNSNAFESIELSPDGSRAAVEYSTISNPDLWVIELARGVATRLTSHPGVDRSHIWSPDGGHIAFQSNRSGVFDLYVKPSSGVGEEELLLKSSSNKTPTSWSSDGQILLYTAADPATRSDIWLVPLRGDRTPVALLRTEFTEFGARFSPDMRWIAYVSNVSGEAEVYVRSFDQSAPTAAPRSLTRVSQAGALLVRWRRDGRELIYHDMAGNVMAVEALPGDTFQLGVPRKLFTLPSLGPWDMTGNGQRFAVPVPTQASVLTAMTVVLNWTSGLGK